MEGEPGALEAWGQRQAGEAGEVTWSRSEAWREKGDGLMLPSPLSRGDGSAAARFWCTRERFHKMGARRVSGSPRALAARV